MPRFLAAAYAISAISGCALVAAVPAARAQSIEPRLYSNAPVGVNFLGAGFIYTRGGLPTDTALPVTNPHLQTSSAILGYARSLDLWGHSGKFDATVPYTWLSGSVDYKNAELTREVSGFGDPSFRLSVNLYGAPAMGLEEFAGYRQDVIVGTSVQVSVPAGQYDSSRLVNIGTHRWSFTPEIGLSKALGSWITEFAFSAQFFTENRDFFGGNSRSQDPLYSMQTHVIYNFRRGVWVSVDANYFTGGRTTINGTLNSDLQQNWRVGGTLALPVSGRSSIKLYAVTGVSARTGNNFDLVGVVWQYRWGGGL